MTKLVALTLALALTAVTNLQADDPAANPPIAHMVYFKLKDSNAKSRQALVDACDKYLASHPGTLFYAAGILAEDLDREVNDRDWDVSLNLVFKDKASHDKYQDAKSHIQFIDENKATWAAVRVFDSYLGKTIVQKRIGGGKKKGTKNKTDKK